MKKGFLQKKNVHEKRNEKQPSLTKKEGNGKDNVDRISTLPTVVVHHILSFLDMKQVIQTSLLSRKWRKSWISLSNISIDDQFWLDKKEDLRQDAFLGFVNKILLHRDGSDIKKFHLSCPHYDSWKNRILAWVVNVVRRNVENLHLQEMFMPPVSSFCFSTSLKTLELTSVSLSEEMEEGSWCSPALENLTIENCCHSCVDRLFISSTQLKYLMVKSEIGDDEFGPCSCEIKICAPNLKFLGCMGVMYKDYCLENLSSLESAHIDGVVCCEETKEVELFASCLNSILRGLSYAKSLTLSLEGIQSSAELRNMLKLVPNSFPNLKYLKLKEWRTNGYIHALAKLFEGFSGIETLILQRVQDKCAMNGGSLSFADQVSSVLFHETEELYGPTRQGDWEKQLVRNCAFHKLKSVELQNIKGSENEFDLIKYLLKTANVLEHIKIISAKGLSRNKEYMLGKFHEKLQALPKASPSATISLVRNTGKNFHPSPCKCS